MNALSLEPIQSILEHVETRILNQITCPVISSVSAAPLRTVLGLTQVIVGFVASIFAFFQQNDRALYYGVHHFTHGVMNLCRAVIEFIPFINLMTVIYDNTVIKNDEHNEREPYNVRYRYQSFEEAQNARLTAMIDLNPPTYASDTSKSAEALA